jgi:hypothetical protein
MIGGQVVRKWTTIDKSSWSRGPWDDEPDKVQWKDEETGFVCLAVRHPDSGHWCGYVGLPESHPGHGQSRDEFRSLDVHGLVTFADFCQEGPEDSSICHVPDSGSDKVYWIGFDCQHIHDRAPGLEALLKKLEDLPVCRSMLPVSRGLVYRTLDYVRKECASLARQLSEEK